MTIDDYLRAYTAKLCDLGAIRSQAVEAAFRNVRRDRCITEFYLSPTDRIDVPQDRVPPPDVLDKIYSNSALLTRLPNPDFSTISSSSLPSLMAEMLEALDLKHGQRVLEIGAGTGYNAALIASITHEPVVSIDVQPKVVQGARAALARLGIEQVTVHCHDGYDGYPAQAPYDRVIVTVACTGISPEWLDQLDDDGLIVAPIAHGGAHPVLAIKSGGHGVIGRPILWTDFMRARGPLYQWPDPRRPLVFEPISVTDVTVHEGIVPPLNAEEYTDLRFFMAIQDDRITEAVAHGVNDDLDKGQCALIDRDLGTAFIKTDAIVLAGASSLLDDIRRLYEGWTLLGRPRLTDWQCVFKIMGDSAGPVLAPAEWP